MLQTRLRCLSPPSPRSRTSSWVRSTAPSVSLNESVLHLFKCTRICVRSPLSLLAGLLSLMGNSILLLVAYHKRSTLKPAEFFIINLSISDLGMTLSLFPLAIPSAFAHRYCTSAQHPPLCLFCFIFWAKKKTQIHFSVRNLSAANSRWWQNEMKSRRIKVDFACQ